MQQSSLVQMELYREHRLVLRDAWREGGWVAVVYPPPGDATPPAVLRTPAANKLQALLAEARGWVDQRLASAGGAMPSFQRAGQARG
jgi:hypothetical protein